MAKESSKEVMTSKQVEDLSTTSITKDNLVETIEVLKGKLKDLAGTDDTKVSLDISYVGKNIQTITKVGDLLQISASLHCRESAYNDEIKRYKLGELPIAPFKESGKTVSHWTKVIGKAINELINKTQIDKIKKTIAGLEKHLSDEEKLKRELSGFMGDAGKMIE